MSVSITLTFRWPMGHRILGLDGPGAKCRNIHGHNWTADITWPNTDGALEFGAVKQTMDAWIGEHLDHGFAAAYNDPFLGYLRSESMKHIALSGPPTTERIAALIADSAHAATGVRPARVHVQEGYRNAATWEVD